MSEANYTLKLTLMEIIVIRKALEKYKQNMANMVNAGGTPTPERIAENDSTLRLLTRIGRSE